MSKQSCNQKREMCVTDLDGTLLNDLRFVSEKDLNTLISLGEQKIIRIIATGRSLFSVNKVLPDDFPIDFLIFSSGAGVLEWNNKQIIHKSQFSSNEVQGLVSEFLNFDVDFMVHDPIPLNHFFSFHHSGNYHDTDFYDRLEIYQPFCSPYIPGVEFPNGSTQLIAILPNNVELFEEISKKLNNCKVIRTTSPLDGKSIWMEIFPVNVSKAHGIEWLCQQLNIQHEKILVVGNDYNDLDMLILSDNSFVVENAPNDLKEQFKVVPSNENSGFSMAVEKWLNFN